MDITNRQHLRNLLFEMHGTNESSLDLPDLDGTPNSINDRSLYASTWTEEFYQLRTEDKDGVVQLKIDGVTLYSYSFMLDEHPVHIVAMEYDTVEPEGVALLEDFIGNEYDLVESWLGVTTLSEYSDGHPIHDFAAMVGYTD